MSDKPERPVLVDQQVALSAYLDSLLREVNVEPAARTDRRAPVRLLHQPEPVAAEGVQIATTQASPVAADAEHPDWAHNRFQCLLFGVRGLTLAVPLEKLCGISEWGDDVTRLPERPPWFLGVMTYRERQCGVIDTAGVVMPERLDAESGCTPYAHIIFFDDGRWGLACERVEQVISLEREQVRWRTSRTRRPWLAGTVIDRMCALLDIDALAGMINGT